MEIYYLAKRKTRNLVTITTSRAHPVFHLARNIQSKCITLNVKLPIKQNQTYSYMDLTPTLRGVQRLFFKDDNAKRPITYTNNISNQY